MKYITAFIAALVAALTLLLSACSSQKKEVPKTDIIDAQTPVEIKDAPLAYIPKAIAYQMNGDYANNVAVLIGPDGKSLMGYPAITDVSANSTPVEIGNGWYLSRAGMIAPNTAFLAYTYQEYSQLGTQPTPKQILEAVIPGAKVTKVQTLDMTTQEALSNIPAIRNTLP